MLAAEMRRHRWTLKRKRDEEQVPCLKTLAELALQKGFEKAGKLLLEKAPSPLTPTPYNHNGELCRILYHRDEGC